MSQELIEFSELIDEEFEITIIVEDNLWFYILNLLGKAA
jgi:hypothetical protein